MNSFNGAQFFFKNQSDCENEAPSIYICVCRDRERERERERERDQVVMGSTPTFHSGN